MRPLNGKGTMFNDQGLLENLLQFTAANYLRFHDALVLACRNVVRDSQLFVQKDRLLRKLLIRFTWNYMTVELFATIELTHSKEFLDGFRLMGDVHKSPLL